MDGQHRPDLHPVHQGRQRAEPGRGHAVARRCEHLLRGPDLRGAGTLASRFGRLRRGSCRAGALRGGRGVGTTLHKNSKEMVDLFIGHFSSLLGII